LSRVQHRETIERLVDRQKNIGPVADREVPGVFRLERLERDGPRAVTATSFRTVPPSVIDEDAPHHVPGDRVKLRAVRPMSARLIDESQVCLVDERGCRQGVTGAFETELPVRDSGQVLVHERDEPIHRAWHTIPQFTEHPGDRVLRDRCHFSSEGLAAASTPRIEATPTAPRR
jgi:hypothetical protein